MANWKGTAVPNTGAISVVYFNHNLSTDEIIDLIDSLTFHIDAGVLKLYFCGVMLDENNRCLMDLSASKMLDQESQVWHYGISIGDNTKSGSTQFYTIWDTTDGWNPDFDDCIFTELILSSVYNGHQVGNQNEALSSLISVTPFIREAVIKSYTLNLVKTASDDYIKDIKQAMIDKGIVEETIPDNELDEAISSFEGGGSTEIVELTVTENGTYNSIPNYEQAKIDQNTEFDFVLPAEIIGIPLSIKKIDGLSFPTSADDIKDGKYTIKIKQNGETAELASETLADVYYDDEIMAYSSNNLQFSILWVVDSTILNQMLGNAYFENNSIYMSDQFIQMYIQQGVQIDEWEAMCDIHVGEKSVAFKPVTVNVQPKIIDTLTVTKNGTYTVPENNDGYKSVDVQIPLQEVLQIYENGTYIPDEGYEGVKKFIVGTPTPKGYITGNRYFDNDIDVLGDGFVVSIDSDLRGAIVTYYYQFAGATFRGNVDFSNLYRTETRKFDEIILREGTFAGCTFDNEAKLILPTTGLTNLIIGDRCFLNCKYLYELDTGEISDDISLGKEVFRDCEHLQTVILNTPELYYDAIDHPYYLYETFKGCTNLKEVVFKNYAGVVFPPMDSFPDNDDLLIYFPDDIVESFKTSSDWADLADKIRPLSEY